MLPSTAAFCPIYPSFYKVPGEGEVVSSGDNFLLRLEQAERKDAQVGADRSRLDKAMLALASASDVLSIATGFEEVQTMDYPSAKELDTALRILRLLVKRQPQRGVDLDMFFHVLEQTVQRPGSSLAEQRLNKHSEAQRAAWTAMFRAADVDLSGLITPDDLAPVVQYQITRQHGSAGRCEDDPVCLRPLFAHIAPAAPAK